MAICEALRRRFIFGSLDMGREPGGALCYGAQIEDPDELWLYCESRSRDAARLFRGRLRAGGGLASWEGEVLAVPKGRLRGVPGDGERASAQLEISASGKARLSLQVAGREELWSPVSLADLAATLNHSCLRPAGFTGGGPLTGVFVGDDGGSYYLRHDAAAGRLSWFAESPDAWPEQWPFLAPARPAGWSQIFAGEAQDGDYVGRSVDVPRGVSASSAQLRVQAASPHELRVDGPEQSRRLWRVDALELQVSVREVEVVEAQDGSAGDQPMVHVALAYVDGSRWRPEQPARLGAELLARRSDALGEAVRAGERVPVHHFVGQFELSLRTRPGTDPATEGREGVWLGLNVGAWERDDTSETSRERMFVDWREALAERLGAGGGRAAPVAGDFAALAAKRSFDFSWHTDDDDFLADGARVFDYAELEALRDAGRCEDFVLDLEGGGGHYRVHCRVEVLSLSPDGTLHCEAAPSEPG